MTKRRLQASIFFVILAFTSIILVAFWCRSEHTAMDFYYTIKDFSSLIIATGATYLAYCFQRRQAFLSSLRDLWREFVEAKGELIEYTHNPHPDQAAFGKAHRALSRAIDTVRGVYRNVGENERKIGLFPFEPLHDMRRTLEELGWTYVTTERQVKARKSLIKSWNALRCAFLKEFSTPEPPHPVTGRWAEDPRRTEHHSQQVSK